MNIIGHYFLDRHQENPFFILGTASPDLLSIYNPAVRVKQAHLKQVDYAALQPQEKHLYQGLARHYQADGIFHTCAFFMEETGWISDALAAAFPEREIGRKYFIGHILLELILDKVIIQHHPDLLRDFYNHFAQLSPFREACRATEHITHHRLPNYEHYLEKFLRNRYMAHYTEWDHIAYVLGRILRRVHLDGHEWLDDERFYTLMEQYEARLQPRYEDFFRWLLTTTGAPVLP